MLQLCCGRVSDAMRPGIVKFSFGLVHFCMGFSDGDEDDIMSFTYIFVYQSVWEFDRKAYERV